MRQMCFNVPFQPWQVAAYLALLQVFTYSDYDEIYVSISKHHFHCIYNHKYTRSFLTYCIS